LLKKLQNPWGYSAVSWRTWKYHSLGSECW